MLEQVEWRDIKGYIGMYQVSSDGRVKNVVTNKDLKIWNSCGYKKVLLSNPNHIGKGITFYVHRLVASTFLDNPNNLPEVDHIDGNRENNKVSNLRWVNRIGNARNPITSERHRQRIRETHCKKEFGDKISKIRSTPEFWEKNKKAYEKVWEETKNRMKENPPNVKKVRCKETGEVWKSCVSLARFLGVGAVSVTRYCQGIRICKRTVTFKDGTIIVNPHFEYVTEEEENTNV